MMSRFLILLMLALAVALGACGDDDEAEVGDQPVPANREAEATGDLEAWCLGWESEPAPLADDASAEEIQTHLEANLVALDALLIVAPSEIAQAMELVVARDRSIMEHIESYGWDLGAPRLPTDPEAEAAVRDVVAFGDDNC